MGLILRIAAQSHRGISNCWVVVTRSTIINDPWQGKIKSNGSASPAAERHPRRVPKPCRILLARAHSQRLRQAFMDVSKHGFSHLRCCMDRQGKGVLAVCAGEQANMHQTQIKLRRLPGPRPQTISSSGTGRVNIISFSFSILTLFSFSSFFLLILSLEPFYLGSLFGPPAMGI